MLKIEADMPTNCWDCPFEKYIFNCHCHIGISSASEYRDEKHPECPIEEVKVAE